VRRSDPFDIARSDFGSMLGRLFWGSEGSGETGLSPFGTAGMFGVDIREDDEHIYVEADLPGFNKEDVEITLEDGVLTISAERHENGETQPLQGEPGLHGQAGRSQSDYLLRERRSQRMTRSFMLPRSVDEEDIHARLQDGVLSITLSKRQESRPKRIQPM
jgi:HSP20 family protein